MTFDLMKSLQRVADDERVDFHARGTCEQAIIEIERLRIGQAVIAKQVGFYKPETPDFEFVSVPLGILRRALHCVPPPYPEDALTSHQGTAGQHSLAEAGDGKAPLSPPASKVSQGGGDG